MKINCKLIYSIAFIVFNIQLYAQQGQWTWMHGDTIGNTNAVYGIKGVSSPFNKPGSVYESAEWTDLQGNFWIFGGTTLLGKKYNILWKYNPGTNEWTWINGDTINIFGVYGTQGVPNINNHPGAREQGVMTWTDSFGDLWLFGGQGYDENGNDGNLNDLWRYNINSNTWTWMKGSSTTGSLGYASPVGISSPLNNPRCRFESSCTWTVGDDLWLYGGAPAVSDGLWKYNINTNQWTLVKGSAYGTIAPVYGIKGIPNVNNTPGSRWVYCRWKDNCNLWLFGGMKSGSGPLNDVWRFDINTNCWTWESGSLIAQDSGYFNGVCSPSVNNIPKSKTENRACWSDKCSNLWVFGGSSGSNHFNDLWHFNILTKEWTLIRKDTANGNFWGSETIANSTNNPSGKSGANSFTDLNGNLWLFGGFTKFSYGNKISNDLWRYKPDSLCPILLCPTDTIVITNDTTICYGDTVLLKIQGGSNYNWSNGSLNSTITVSPNTTTTYSVLVTNSQGCDISKSVTVTVQAPNQISVLGNDSTLCYGDTLTINLPTTFNLYLWQNGSANLINSISQSGTYWVKAISANHCISLDTLHLTFLPLPTVNLGNDTSICQGNSIILNAGNSSGLYQWNTGAQSQTITVLNSGTYWVEVTDTNGCSSNDTNLINSLPLPSFSLGNDTSFCSNQVFSINLNAGNNGSSFLWSTGQLTQNINVTNFGSYWAKVTNINGCVANDTITINSLPIPLVNLGNDTSICQGSLINLNAGNSSNTYQWNTGANTQTITVSNAGTYWVNVNNNNCNNTDTVHITISQKPSLDLGNDTTICLGELIVLKAGQGYSYYLWSDGSVFDYLNVSIPGIYSVSVYSGNCSSNDTITIENCISEIFVPNVFTPNGDDINDFFKPEIKNIIKISLFIYNRWGNQLYEDSGISVSWDGKYNNKLCPAGVYYYLIEYESNNNKEIQTIHGSITILY